MKRVLILLLGAVIITGCRSGYVITLNNRSQLVASSKPVLKGGVYVYKDAQGRDCYVPAGRVAEVAPASMAEKPRTTAASAK